MTENTIPRQVLIDWTEGNSKEDLFRLYWGKLTVTEQLELFAQSLIMAQDVDLQEMDELNEELSGIVNRK